MAIKPCNDCGGPVSDNAESCPKCGSKQPKKSNPLVWVFLVMFILFGIGFCNYNGFTLGPTDTYKSNHDNEKQQTEQAATKSNWDYSSSKDEMRGTEAFYASTTSLNKVDFDFPYDGGSSLDLMIRKNDGKLDLLLEISKGQFLCGYPTCEAVFKFDDGQVKQITLVLPDNHSTEYLFVRYDKTAAQLLEDIKKSKKLVIEVPFYQEGRHQFNFNIEGLDF